MLEHKELFPYDVREKLDQLAIISKKLRKERELSFYGDIDFIPTEEYTIYDAKEAIDGANFVVSVVTRFMEKVSPTKNE
ncbi:MAG: hypothetical protein RMJ39_09870 [Deltaproteobacteria bacterium]|nr:hypothetical protein [Deltaproteobacteria bacterium]MDW8034482.1 hypothetical protein [Nitrososphaerota archaeon]